MAVDYDNLRMPLVTDNGHDVFVRKTHKVLLESASLGAVSAADLDFARNESVRLQVADDVASRYESVLVACGLGSVTCLKRSQCCVVV
jgi:hypothetical protein